MSDYAIDLVRRALVVALELSLPMLAVGLAIGLVVTLFQALTQLQEQTLTFVPKIFGLGLALFILTPWMLTVITEYMRDMFGEIGPPSLP